MFRSNPIFFGVFSFYHGINVGIGSPKADFGWVGSALTQFCGSWSFFNVGLVDGVGEKLEVMGFTRIRAHMKCTGLWVNPGKGYGQGPYWA